MSAVFSDLAQNFWSGLHPIGAQMMAFNNTQDPKAVHFPKR